MIHDDQPPPQSYEPSPISHAPRPHLAAPSRISSGGIDALQRGEMKRRMSLNLDEPLVTQSESLDVLVRYYHGTIEPHAVVSLLAEQGVALPNAWLAVGRAHNIQADVTRARLVGAQIDDGVYLTHEGLAWWLAQIRDTELELHIARGLWLISQLEPVLSAHDMRHLKARFLVHDIGKLGPLGLHPEGVRMVLHSFELRQVVLHHSVAAVFREHFGSRSEWLITEINRHMAQTRIGPQTTIRAYFDYHEAWGGQRLAQLCAEGHVSDRVASHAHKHHHIDRSHASVGLITYLDMYEASTSRMSYDAVTGRETRCDHAAAMAAIWQRFDHVDRGHLGPVQISDYIHLLTRMDGLGPPFSPRSDLS